MQNPNIERLAFELLDDRELKLAEHLTFLVRGDKWDAGPLIKDILPTYNEGMRNRYPGNIYRPLMYIHIWSSPACQFRNMTRSILDSTGAHLEGCLQIMMKESEYSGRLLGLAFGNAVHELGRRGILLPDFAALLLQFNRAVNVPAKHFGVYAPTDFLHERTFSPADATHAIISMRKLSIRVFSILRGNGIPMSAEWPEFNEKWLSRFDRQNKP